MDNTTTVRVYLARGMSGRSSAEVLAESMHDRLMFKFFKVTTLDPVEEEVDSIDPQGRIQATKTNMQMFWPRDKAMIRAAHVFVDCTPHLKSQGVEREAGFARYHLWKPVVRVFPRGEVPPDGALCYFEDDLIVDNIGYAAQEIIYRWGTPWKRLKWKFGIVKKSFLKAIKTRILWLVDWAY